MSYVSHQPILLKRGSGGVRSPFVPMSPAYSADMQPGMRYVMSTPLRYRPDVRSGSISSPKPGAQAPRQRFMTATSISSNPLRRQNLMPLYQQPTLVQPQPQPEQQMIMVIPTSAAGQPMHMPANNVERIQMHHPIDDNPYHMVPYGSSTNHSATCTII